MVQPHFRLWYSSNLNDLSWIQHPLTYKPRFDTDSIDQQLAIISLSIQTIFNQMWAKNSTSRWPTTIPYRCTSPPKIWGRWQRIYSIVWIALIIEVHMWRLDPYATRYTPQKLYITDHQRRFVRCMFVVWSRLIERYWLNYFFFDPADKLQVSMKKKKILVEDEPHVK